MKNKLLMLTFLGIVSLQASDALKEEKHSVREVLDSIGKPEGKELNFVDGMKHMFVDGKVSTQLRTMYAGYHQKDNTTPNTYATAIGGILKYELAEYKGLSAGAALYASKDINFATGNGTKQNSKLSSSDGSYADLAEAYINYNYEDISIRVGRQTLDTPLADSDDIRMIQNSFNAYVLSYTYEGIDFMAGHIVSWQGVDAGLDAGWQRPAEKTNGTNFGGISYDDGLEFGLWYYNMTHQANALYTEFGGHFNLRKDVAIHTMAQYLHESELDNSRVGADIYGALFDFTFSHIGFHVAYDKANKKTGLRVFSGLGGGTMFTSMDTMIIENIAVDRDAKALVSGVTYEYNDLSFLYAYGDFKGDADSAGAKAHIVEQDISLEYTLNDALLISAVYAISEDKESDAYTSDDWNRLQVMINYNF